MSKNIDMRKMKKLVKEPIEIKKKVASSRDEAKTRKRPCEKLNDQNENDSNSRMAVKAKQTKINKDKSVKRRIDFNENQTVETDMQENNNSTKINNKVLIPNVTKQKEIKTRSRSRTKSNLHKEMGVNQGNSGISPGDRVQWTQEFLDKVRRSNERHKKGDKIRN